MIMLKVEKAIIMQHCKNAVNEIWQPPQRPSQLRGTMSLESFSWWRHQVETFSALLAFVRGIHRSPADLRLNKRLNKQTRRRWFETPSRSLSRHCKVIIQLPVQLFYSLDGRRLARVVIPITNLKLSDDRLRFILGIPTSDGVLLVNRRYENRTWSSLCMLMSQHPTRPSADTMMTE